VWKLTLYWKLREKISLCQQTLRISKGRKVEVLKLDDGMENLLYLEYTYVIIWIFKFGVYMHILEMVTIHLLDDECLSQWAWMLILKHIRFVMLPTLLLSILAMGNARSHDQENLLPPLSLNDLLRASTKLWSVILPQ
jgi:hypothetical protein